jgi:hypothetical protein
MYALQSDAAGTVVENDGASTIAGPLHGRNLEHRATYLRCPIECPAADFGE